jgi:hypothetical protein
MKEFFTPLRVLSAVGLGLLLVLWICSMVGLMANTKLGNYFRHGEALVGKR